MSEPYAELMNHLGYHFKDEALLRRALTHRSHHDANNERLEFLGDAVLGLVIGNYLYEQYPDAAEGELSRRRSGLVSGDVLAQLADELQLQPYLRLGQGEENSGGRNRPSILADVVEALIAVIYLEGGLEQARQCILRWSEARIKNMQVSPAIKDSKSQLQEWVQARHMPLPCYKARVTGAAHQQTFFVTCTVEGLDIEVQGQSTSRRKAEQLAAARFLEQLSEQ